MALLTTAPSLLPASAVVWLTGLSGAGKTTLAHALATALTAQGQPCYVLDGDALRQGLNSDLGFSAADRAENIRRVAEVAKLFAACGVTPIVACISPTHAIRARAREIIGAAHFIEVYVSTPIEVCLLRDTKGLYAKAQRGEIENFTGVSAPYEAPASPSITINTAALTVEQATQQLLRALATQR